MGQSENIATAETTPPRRPAAPTFLDHPSLCGNRVDLKESLLFGLLVGAGCGWLNNAVGSYARETGNGGAVAGGLYSRWVGGAGL
jgi:hypothetical protein